MGIGVCIGIGVGVGMSSEGVMWCFEGTQHPERPQRVGRIGRKVQCNRVLQEMSLLRTTSAYDPIYSRDRTDTT